jgi:hypothetical protein
MYGIDRFKVNRLKKALEEKALLLYIVDCSEIRREIY